MINEVLATSFFSVTGLEPALPFCGDCFIFAKEQYNGA